MVHLSPENGYTSENHGVFLPKTMSTKEKKIFYYETAISRNYNTFVHSTPLKVKIRVISVRFDYREQHIEDRLTSWHPDPIYIRVLDRFIILLLLLLLRYPDVGKIRIDPPVRGRLIPVISFSRSTRVMRIGASYTHTHGHILSDGTRVSIRRRCSTPTFVRTVLFRS